PSQDCGGVTTSGIKCTNDTECSQQKGMGWVCSNSPETCPEYQTCIQGCHSDKDCNIGYKCDNTSKPHWKCKNFNAKI
ncbi:34233_t:CDS:1, partial [Gigaspora margarita]